MGQAMSGASFAVGNKSRTMAGMSDAPPVTLQVIRW